MKLSWEFLLYQLRTQCLPGLDQQREGFRPPLLDARLHPLWADGIDNQSPSRHLGAQGPEPPQGIYKADPLSAEMLQCR
jgi:hypothetical protein